MHLISIASYFGFFLINPFVQFFYRCKRQTGLFPLTNSILLNSKNAYLIAGLFVVSFLFMDLVLLTDRIGHRNRNGLKLLSDNSSSIFEPLTVKKMMMSPPTHYIRSPIAEFVENSLHFSHYFPFISANLISFIHGCISLISFKFFSSDLLIWRQVGVLMFQLRNFLDSLDGVVCRAQSSTRKAYKSYHDTAGYFIDAFSDVLGCLFLICSIGIYLKNKHKPVSSCFVNNRNENSLSSPAQKTLPFFNQRLDKEWQFGKPITEYITKRDILISISLLGIRLALSAFFWDRSVLLFENLFDSQTAFKSSASLLKTRTELMNSNMNIFILLAWRYLCGLSLIDYILFAVFVDKIWEFVKYSEKIGWFLLVGLVILTEIHASQIKSVLSAVV